jgi:hypothetical protein
MVVGFSPTNADAEVAVLSGWFKFAQKASTPPMTYRFAAPYASITTQGATAVVHAANPSAEVFVESGSIKLVDTEAKGAPGTQVVVKAGEFARLQPGQPAGISPRPHPDFVSAMPRGFRDPLPAIADKYKDQVIEPKREHDVSYAEVEDWLKAGFPVRKGFVKRFQSRAQDAEFRSALIRNLREHPEWDRTLFPQKYETTRSK